MYPPCFNELMVNYMSEQVVGLKGVPKADAKWQAHFNDTRKTAKKEMEVNPHGFPFFPLPCHFLPFFIGSVQTQGEPQQRALRPVL